MTKRLTAVIIGAGHRAVIYASYAQAHPDELAIVGMADPSPLRRSQTAAAFDLPPDRCFETAEALASVPRFADFAINGTMDHQHVPTSLPLLAAGYDLLLEKPFATNEAEMWAACPRGAQIRPQGRDLPRAALCAVLRGHPPEGGRRRHWRNPERPGGRACLLSSCGGRLRAGQVEPEGLLPLLDADGEVVPRPGSDHLDEERGAAAAGRLLSAATSSFAPKKRPPGAGTRCLVDCPIEADCLYSARKHYIDHPDRWAFYVWDSLEHLAAPTIADKIASLKVSPYGRCVWKTDMDVVDHQTVLIDFADGCTATLNMIGGAAKPSRTIHLIGTRGEIRGCLEDSVFTILRPDLRPGHETAEEIVDLNVGGDMVGAGGGHAGGDMRLVADFLKLVNGEPPSLSSTNLEDSVSGHLIGFCADRAMAEGRVVEIAAGPPADGGRRG